MTEKKINHILSLDDLSANEIQSIIDRAIQLKSDKKNGTTKQTLEGKSILMLFEKQSTRTRLGFQIGIQQLGGMVVPMSTLESQIDRGETISDTAHIISRMFDLAVIRTSTQQRLNAFVAGASIPVVNALTDEYHPCQLLADLMTIQEKNQNIQSTTVAWIGDGNNICNTYIQAAKKMKFQLKIYVPEGYMNLNFSEVENVTLCKSPIECASDSDVVTTDVWESMGQETDSKRKHAFAHSQVNAAIMKVAKPNAIFLHCLPAHRNEEVTAEVIDGKQSLVWEQAENKLHTQKALLEWILSPIEAYTN